MDEEWRKDYIFNRQGWIEYNEKQDYNYFIKFKEYIDWDSAITIQDFPEYVLRNVSEYLDWDLVVRNQILSEEFMEDYMFFIDWEIASLEQEMSEEFVEKFKEFIPEGNRNVFKSYNYKIFSKIRPDSDET